MNKKYALIFALLFTLLIAFDMFLISHQPKKLETIKIIRAIDGDTIEMENGEIIRFANINTPEKGSFGYEEAKNFLKAFENKSISIERLGNEKYGRVLARVYSPDYLNLEIIKEGLGNKFLVEEEEKEIFAEAEQEAIKLSAGLWKKSQYFGCFEAEVDAQQENVKIKNNCKNTNAEDWVIKDESRKKYKFASIALGEINLYSGKGEDNETDLFWNGQDVWNNDRDTMYLFDKEGKMVLYYSYGY